VIKRKQVNRYGVDGNAGSMEQSHDVAAEKISGGLVGIVEKSRKRTHEKMPPAQR